MILRKPYAFLIKHFKLIHIILVILLCVNLYYYMAIINFYNAYIANGYRAISTFNLVETYTPFTFLLAILFSIALPVVLYILLSYKKKPNKIYVYIILYYIILLGLYSYLQGIFEIITDGVITATLSRLIRDVAIIYAIPQVPFIVVMFVRALGFNLKKFAFEEDFKDMKLDFKDNEEVEFEINFNGDKLKRKVRRGIREFKYYLVENKFIVSLIVVFSLGIIGYYIYNTIRPSYERYLNTGQSFIYKDFEITVADSLITSTDLKGNEINPGYYYVVLKVNVKNLVEASNTFDFNIIKLITDDGYVSPKQSLVSNFADYGSTDVNGYILAKDSKDYVMCYEINSNNIKNNYRLVVSNGIANFRGEIYTKSIYINIAPVANNYQKVSNYNINDVITFEDDFLKDNTLQITKVNISKKVRYTYDSCTSENNCKELINLITVPALDNRQNNYLVSINGVYENNNGNSRYNSISQLFEKNAIIEYVYEEETKKSNIINVTPSNYKDGVILEVDNEVFKASKINVIISTRNNKYVISVK